MNFLNFPNVISFKSSFSILQIFLFIMRFLPLRFVNGIMDINIKFFSNLYITYVIIYSFSFGHVGAVVIMIVWFWIYSYLYVISP
jgi:hypothetical protein